MRPDQSARAFPPRAAAALVGLVLASPLPAHATDAPVPAEIHVAADGDDRDDGSAQHPFATLARAQAEMRAGGARVAVIGGGVYQLRGPLSLQAEDSGASFVAAAGETPVLDGAVFQLGPLVAINGASGITLKGLGFTNAVRGTPALRLTESLGIQVIGNRFDGNDTAILLDASSGNTVCANRIDNAVHSGIEAKDGSDDNVFDSNVIDGTRAVATYGGAFFLHGVNRSAIVHNLIRDAAGGGIVVANWGPGTLNIGNTIAYNMVRDTNLLSIDSGAIYVLGRSHADTRTTIAHNLIDGTGAGDEAHTIGIYLDDSTSGVLVQNNVVRNIGTHAVQIHGGDDITIHNNIFDLGAGTASAVLFQSAPDDTNPTNTMRNNRVTGNLILSRGASATAYAYIDGGPPIISENFYHGPVGRTATALPLARDAAPFVSAPAAAQSALAKPDPAAIEPLAAAAIGFSPIDKSKIGLYSETAGCRDAVRQLRATISHDQGAP